MALSNISMATVIEKTINQGREDKSSEFKKAKLEYVLNNKDFEGFQQFSHIMIYCKSNKSLFNNFPIKAAVLMQMGYDGYIGFPGGLHKKNETPLQAIYRIIKEHVGWDVESDKEKITDRDYFFTFLSENSEMILHFYVKEIAEKNFVEIEENLTKAPAYRTEVLGSFRVPLYIMGDAFRGFPSFLRNHFANISKLQLIEAVIKLGFLTEEQIIQALNSAPKITF